MTNSHQRAVGHAIHATARPLVGLGSAVFLLLAVGSALMPLLFSPESFHNKGSPSRSSVSSGFADAAFDRNYYDMEEALPLGDALKEKQGQDHHFNGAEQYFSAPRIHHKGFRTGHTAQDLHRAMRNQNTCPPFCDHGSCPAGQSACICHQEPGLGFWRVMPGGVACDACSKGFAGEQCTQECPGGSCNVCNGHGNCDEGKTGTGICQCTGKFTGVECSECQSGHFGANCEISCATDPSTGLACYGRGVCAQSTDGSGSCVCDAGFGSETDCLDCDSAHYGQDCQLPCAGYLAIGTGVACSGHGVCFNGSAVGKNGSCVCTPGSGYGTADCSVQCPNECSGHGWCDEGAANSAECQCVENWAPPDCSKCVSSRTGPSCQYLCSVNNETNQICSLQGKCIYDATAGWTQLNYTSRNLTTVTLTPIGLPLCDCIPGFAGEVCERKCAGNPPCSGHGLCGFNEFGNVTTCTCSNNTETGFWGGADCSVCQLAYDNSYNCTEKCPVNPTTGVVCSGRGTCMSGRCFCVRIDPLNGKEICGDACEYSQFTSNPLTNECQLPTGYPPHYCMEPFRFGPSCLRCPGYADTSSGEHACNNHGLCIQGKEPKDKVGKCECFYDFVGTACEHTCPPQVSGRKVCSGIGRGRCSLIGDGFNAKVPACGCYDPYAGADCQLDCPTVAGDICAGHGTCNNTYLGDATCNCTAGWTGIGCNVPCKCNSEFGRCNATTCRDYLPTQICTDCLCDGNFSAVGMCDTCIPGTQGPTCEGECVNGITDPKGRSCQCFTNYSTATCEYKCPADPFGQVCGGHGTCLDGSSIQGRCSCDLAPKATYPVWFLPNCTKGCTREYCTNTFGLVNPQCSPTTGQCECLHDATGGYWAGATCEECVPGYWNQKCTDVCFCSLHGSCDKTSGGDCKCYASKSQGYYSGTSCDVCADGFIGQNCEQKNIKITRLGDQTRSQPSGIYHTKSIFDTPYPEALAVDEELSRLYIGGNPLFQVNTSGTSQLTKLGDSNTNPVFKCANTTAEIAFVSIQPDVLGARHSYVFFLVQPVWSMECNSTVRLLRLDRKKAMSEAKEVWTCTDSWCDETVRVVASADRRATSDGHSEAKLLAFVIQNRLPTTVPGESGWVYSGGGYMYRMNLNVEIIKVTTLALSPTFRVRDMAFNTVGSTLATPIAVSGSDITDPQNPVWDVNIYSVNISQGIAAVNHDYSLRDKTRTPCWSNFAGTVDADLCKGCHVAVALHYNGDTLVVGIDQQTSSTDLPQAFLVWFRPIDPMYTFQGQKLVALHDQRCKVVTVDIGPNTYRLVDSGGQITNPLSGLTQQYYTMLASSNEVDSNVESLTFDHAANFSYASFSIKGKSEPSIVAKISNDVTNFAVYGTATDLGFVSSAQQARPEVFPRLQVDPVGRILYGLIERSINLRVASFLLFDIVEVTPNVVDQREGTILTLRGSGFQRVPMNPELGDASPTYPVLCRFGLVGGYKYTPANVTFTELQCRSSRADNESAAGDSCSGQPIEVSLTGETWFTANGETIKRVPGARLVSVTPVRGPLKDGPVVTITGSGFVASSSAICMFYSNNTAAAGVRILTSSMKFVTPTTVTCQQPDADVASYDPSLLEVLLDGQRPSESGPIEYFIVGAAANLTSPPQIVVKAQTNTTFNLTVKVVDERRHPRDTLDTVTRPVSIFNGSVSPCKSSVFGTWYPDTGSLLADWSLVYSGKNNYPGDSCRDLVVEMTGKEVRDTVNGSITFEDLYLFEPRKGTVLITFTDVDHGWPTSTLVRVIEGDPVALMIQNWKDLALLDASATCSADGTCVATKGFIENAPIVMDVIVVDALANIVDSPGAPGGLTVEAHIFEISDVKQRRIRPNETEQYNSTRTIGEKVRLTHSENAGPIISFATTIIPKYVHAVSHYVNFSTPNRPYKPVLSPPLRTALCESHEYKIPGIVLGKTASTALTGTCGKCPPLGAVCNGSEVIMMLDGFWRSEDSPTEIYECELVDPPICLMSAAGPACKEGHTGPLCSLCEPGWGKSGKTCAPCPDEGDAITTIVFGALAFVLALLAWTVMTLRKAEVTELSVIMRSVVNHMQATGKLGEFSTQWGPLAKKVFAFQSAGSDVSISGLSSVECLLRKNNLNYSTIFAAYMSLPMLSVSMAFLVYVVVRAAKLKPVITDKLRREIEEEIKNLPSTHLRRLLEFYPFYFVMVTTFCVHMFAMYQTFITQSTLVLKCKELVESSEYVDGVMVKTPKYYLAVDMSVPCEADGHHSFRTAALMCAIGYGLGVPIIFVAGYKFVNSRLNKLELTKLMFMFLIGGYKDEYWFWQAIIMIRKLALVLIIVFVEENRHMQSYMGMWALALALMVQILFNPNTDPEHNLVEALSLAIITVTLNLGLLYLWPGAQGEHNQATRDVLTVFLVIITIGAMIMFAYFMSGPIKKAVLEQFGVAKEKYNKFRGKEGESEEDKQKRRDEALERTKKRQRLQALARNIDDDEFMEKAEMKTTKLGAAAGATMAAKQKAAADFRKKEAEFNAWGDPLDGVDEEEMGAYNPNVHHQGHSFMELEDDRDPTGGFYEPPSATRGSGADGQSVLHTGRAVGGGMFRTENSINGGGHDAAPNFSGAGDDDDDVLGIFSSDSQSGAPPLPRAQQRQIVFHDAFDDEEL